MRVLHVAETLPGGPASYLKEILPYQLERFGSDNVAVLIPEDQQDHLLGFSGRYYTFFRSGRNIKSIIALMAALDSALLDQWDVIHLHSSFAGFVGRFLRIRHRSGTTKIVYCAHCWAFDRPVIGFKERIFIALEWYLSRFTDAIVAISPHEVELIRKFRFPMDRVVQVLSGISDLDNDINAPDVPGMPVRLLYVGRLDRQKGVDLLVEQLKSLSFDFELTVVGAGVLSEKAAYDFPESTKKLGWISREEIPQLMSSADFLLLPSRWEGMPLIALEALRSGLPIIGNKIGAVESIKALAEGEFNPVYIIDFDVPGSLDLCLSSLLIHDDSFLRKRLARQLYLDRFTSAAMNEGLVELYLSLSIDG